MRERLLSQVRARRTSIYHHISRNNDKDGKKQVFIGAKMKKKKKKSNRLNNTVVECYEAKVPTVGAGTRQKQVSG